MFINKVAVFLIGGAAYQGIEILWRGFTHPSMFFAGGLCLLAIDFINGIFGRKSVPFTAALCGTVITIVELAAGTVINVIMGMSVWDYSDVPFNFMGQICPVYTLLWILISIPAIYICRLIEKASKSIFKSKGRP